MSAKVRRANPFIGATLIIPNVARLARSVENVVGE